MQEMQRETFTGVTLRNLRLGTVDLYTFMYCTRMYDGEK